MVESVYFLLCGVYVKIGYTDQSVPERLKAVRTHNPYDVTLLRVVAGDRFTEKWLHDYFREFHHRGEWFKFSEEMLTIQPSEVLRFQLEERARFRAEAKAKFQARALALEKAIEDGRIASITYRAKVIDEMNQYWERYFQREP